MTEKFINYDGTERKLVYDIDALTDAESISGKAFGEVMINPISGLMNLHTLKAYLFTGLKSSDPDINMPQISVIINAALKSGKDLRVIIDDISEALYNSGILSRPKKAEKGKAEKNS
jgi:hypothetical protein